MPEEPTTPDLVELVRGMYEAWERHDFDAIMALYAPDAVIDGTPTTDHFEGKSAIRGFLEDFAQTFERLEITPDDIFDLGGGIVLVINRIRGLHAGSKVELHMRDAHVYEWVKGAVVRITLDTDIERARGAAERLAEERG